MAASERAPPGPRGPHGRAHRDLADLQHQRRGWRGDHHGRQSVRDPAGSAPVGQPGLDERTVERRAGRPAHRRRGLDHRALPAVDRDPAAPAALVGGLVVVPGGRAPHRTRVCRPLRRCRRRARLDGRTRSVPDRADRDRRRRPPLSPARDRPDRQSDGRLCARDRDPGRPLRGVDPPAPGRTGGRDPGADDRGGGVDAGSLGPLPAGPAAGSADRRPAVRSRSLRRRTDVASQFAERLRHEVDIHAVGADLEDTVRAAIQPERLGLWLRRGAGRDDRRKACRSEPDAPRLGSRGRRRRDVHRRQPRRSEARLRDHRAPCWSGSRHSWLSAPSWSLASRRTRSASCCSRPAPPRSPPR